ncbi:hypothetical protein [Longibacter sp.]|jgi:hypothetical protein|uniref:hypothetical protein n=1 Tax=Longibacter sp. TaxID=2045415 RepID=UPI003EBEDB9B
MVSDHVMTAFPRAVRYFAVLLASLVTLFAMPGDGQAQPGLGEGGEGLIIDFSRPGQPTMIVYLWGGVGRTGLWRVERDVDLVELLTAAGVPSIGDNPAGTRRRTVLRIYRTNDNDRRQIFEQRVDDILAEGSTYPPLQPRDIIEIEVRERRAIGLQLIGTLVSTASTVTLLILRLTSGT